MVVLCCNDGNKVEFPRIQSNYIDNIISDTDSDSNTREQIYIDISSKTAKNLKSVLDGQISGRDWDKVTHESLWNSVKAIEILDTNAFNNTILRAYGRDIIKKY
jgi:hypothetical protein